MTDSTDYSRIDGDYSTLPGEPELREWDWAAEVKASGRPYSWLARETNRAAQTIYQYRSGQTRPSTRWLRAAWAVLHR